MAEGVWKGVATKRKKKRGGKKKRRMKIVATTSLSAVDRPNAGTPHARAKMTIIGILS